MGTIAISDYLSSRPAASTPLGDTDMLLVIQGGSVNQVASGDVGAGLVDLVLINPTINPTTLLPASGEIVYEKSDESATVCNFAVSVVGQTMCLELQNGLSAYGESIRVRLVGNNWYRIS